MIQWIEALKGKMEKIDGHYEIIYDAQNPRTGFQYGVAHEYGTHFIPIGSVENPLKYTSMSGKHSQRPFIRPAIRKTMWELSKIQNFLEMPEEEQIMDMIVRKAKYNAPRYTGALVKSIRWKKL